MPVVIDEVATEVVVEPQGAGGGRGAGGPPEPAPAEVQVEALRPIIREILAEEIARHLRQALPR